MFLEESQHIFYNENKIGEKYYEAVMIIRKVTGINNSHEIQNLETAKRDLILKKLRQSGISIRQISRLTGVSFNVVRKF